MSLEQTIDNLQIRNANMVTFVGTSNTMIDTTTGRIQTKGIQHNSNVITDVSGPHGRGVATLKKYPEIAFDALKLDGNDTTNTYTQAGYTVTASSDQSQYNLHAWRVFDGNTTSPGNGWASQDGTYYDGTSPANSYTGTTHQLGTGTAHGEWLKLELPHKIKVSRFSLYADPGSGYGTNEAPKSYKIYGSVLGSTWTELKNVSGEVPSVNGNSHDITDTTAYKYLAIVVTQVNTDQDNIRIGELKFYGYEEDPPAGDHSVDTTFKSRFNNPQTTGVQVLVDGATGVGTNQISGGPDPSGNQSTYDSTGKYWTLNGTLTSNLSVEANTFLEGDQPHAVSVWFNSSNLEANVSNTCVFSIASEEKLDSVNLDLQSNTWHNLTYAYQGEGGSRVTYLDGRKVSEDQAEDTFGDYPPFAMTGYSQGGYVVSASSDTYSTTGFYAWKAFNDVQGNEGWHTGTGNGATNHFAANAGGSVYDASLSGGTSSPLSGNLGEWIKLEMPHKLVVDYVTLKARGTGTASTQSPKDFKILGSNDDINWDILESFTSVPYSMTGENHVVGATKGYKYIAFLVTRIYSTTNSSCVVGEIEYYGHRENDLVRLPDPTNVLKYPHITMTGPAQRGYVASASGNHSNGNHPTWKVFDGVITNDWQINGGRYSNSGGVYTHNAGETTVTNVQSRVGDWVQLESPHKIRVKTMKFTPIATYGQERSPATGVLVGSNDDGSTWTEIKVFDVTTDGTPTSYTAASPTTLAIDSGSNSTPGYYKIHRLIWLTLYTASQTTYADRASVADLELYGTGVDSIPIQIGGGNIDKVANFRVYDKFIEEDQVNEIWNAQKEEFGRAKPQMVLQQGKLGIGTDAPQGSLSVADEPHNLEEFPPRAMTGYKNYFEGHGEFCASASSKYLAPSATEYTYLAYQGFDRKHKNAGNGWSDITWNSVSPSYDSSTGTVSTDASLGSYMGEWLKLSLPYGVKISGYQLGIRSAWFNYGPDNWVILGSNDDKNWDLVSSVTTGRIAQGTNGDQIMTKDFTVETTKYYKYLALVCSKVAGPVNQVNFAELRYFGIREQGQSVLHDGQLTLTKNLDVPRIGPPLDADDTPRRDRLVVEYNTSSNPTFEGAVRDTSGRGNDGMFRGGAFYSDAEKALVFDGNADYVESPPLGWSGAQQHSVSVWIKLDLMTNPHSTSIQNAWTIVNGGATNRVSHLHIFTNGTIEWAFNGNNATTGSGFIQAGTWYHVVCVYNGGAGNDASSRRMWINGDEKSWNSLGSSSTLNLEPEATFALGYNKQLNNYDHDGSVSNAKLYDVALTSEDVKTLYDMGRMGGKANPQPLHISGPVNVMGDIRYITSRPLALPTMWDHEANGHFTRGIYPITGTQGGSKVYNMLCEPDWCGGGWMCVAQLPKGKDVVTTPVNLFTDEYGDPSNLTWSNDFAVPINIFSNNSGYDLDVMLVLLGGTRAGRAGAGGARNGGIYRGVNLTQALNTGWPTNGAYPVNISTSGLASSADGYNFVSRTPSGYNYQPYKANTGWRLSFSSLNGYPMSYNDADINTMGWLVHTNGNNLHYTYSSVHGGGGSQAQTSETSWAAVRFFVRPKRY